KRTASAAALTRIGTEKVVSSEVDVAANASGRSTAPSRALERGDSVRRHEARLARPRRSPAFGLWLRVRRGAWSDPAGARHLRPVAGGGPRGGLSRGARGGGGCVFGPSPPAGRARPPPPHGGTPSGAGPLPPPR